MQCQWLAWILKNWQSWPLSNQRWNLFCILLLSSISTNVICEQHHHNCNDFRNIKPKLFWNFVRLGVWGKTILQLLNIDYSSGNLFEQHRSISVQTWRTISEPPLDITCGPRPADIWIQGPKQKYLCSLKCLERSYRHFPDMFWKVSYICNMFSVWTKTKNVFRPSGFSCDGKTTHFPNWISKMPYKHFSNMIWKMSYE